MDSRASALVPRKGNPKRTLRVGILQSAARLSEYADAPRFPKQFSTFPLKSVNLPKIGQLGLLFAVSGSVALLSNYWGVVVVSFLYSNTRRVSCALAFKKLVFRTCHCRRCVLSVCFESLPFANPFGE